MTPYRGHTGTQAILALGSIKAVRLMISDGHLNVGYSNRTNDLTEIALDDAPDNAGEKGKKDGKKEKEEKPPAVSIRQLV